ncbi:MAG: NUDIX domain-containing protein [Mobilitalea sp.]
MINEYQDIYDGFGQKTGRKIPRGENLSDGEYIYAVHVYIKNKDGTWLIQQRAYSLRTNPGHWEFTSGRLLSEENSISAAKRETQEEIGIILKDEQLQLVGTFKRKRNFVDIWFAKVDIPIDEYLIDVSEVAAVKYIAKHELIDLINKLPYREIEYKELVINSLRKN